MNKNVIRTVEFIALGGTIASTSRPGTEGVVPELTAAEMIEALPRAPGILVRARNLANVPSIEISPALLFDLVAAIKSCEAEGAAGVVITQGTDTIEETAFALDLILSTDMPVIITGAMRNASQPGSDGPANLTAAIACATDAVCRRQGVLVVVDDVIHAAAWVQKRDTSATGAFWSPSPLGRITEGDAALHAPALQRPAIEIPRTNQLPFVPILKPGLAEPPIMAGAAVTAGAAGLVVELAGGGHASLAWADALATVARDIPVVFASRTRGGRVLSRTYGQPGAEIDLIRRGLVGSGDLDALKARLLLSLLLAVGTPDRFREFADLSWRPVQ